MYNIGIEREGLRCTEEGELSDEPHPRAFGDRNKNDFITTDFGSAQMEIRTPICESTKECYEKLENITNVVINELSNKKELLWPYSMPCILPDVKNFKFGEYGENIKEKEYEQFLFKKYGFEMYCMSGVHLNFSIKPEYYNTLLEMNSKLPPNLDDAYFKIVRNYQKMVWMLIYLFGATPEQYGKNSYKNKCSIRNSLKQGFKNINLTPINFENKELHIKSIEENIKSGNISAVTELYIPIRIKNKGKNNIDELKNNPIDHLEVRVFDLNPFDKCAISIEQMDFTIALLFYCLLSDEKNYNYNYREIAENGINDAQGIIIGNEIEQIKKINKKYSLGFGQSISKIEDEFKSGINIAKKIENEIDNKGYIKCLTDLAIKYRDEAEQAKYSIKYKNNIVSSVTAALIKDGLSHGINYDFVDFKDYDSLVKFSTTKKSEYIIGATRTIKDNLTITYITDDKYFAKQLMKSNNIRVPKGIMINKGIKKSELGKMCKEYAGRQIVVKPRNTNSGIGITVYSEPANFKQLKNAIAYAFKFDKDVLLEEYIEGDEYRFIIIDGKFVSVVLRRNARVIGNGNNTIRELIAMKNSEEWHILLKTKIKLDSPLKKFLKRKNLTLDYIPKKGEIVYLRENSNCSTGGESINMTDIMPEYFKKLAENASKIFEAHICGVDMIINDISKKDYAILEVNNDPGYDINEWPYEGENSKIGLQILKMLKLTDCYEDAIMRIEDNNSKYERNCKLEGYSNLEPSTIVLIKAAIANKVKYEIIDENKSFIKLYDDKHTEYVVQATKTSKDQDTFPFISDNKALVKKILRENNIIVPNGTVLNSTMTKFERNKLVKPFEQDRIVVKPNTTNCGIGITVFNKVATKREIDNAIKKAFKYDSNVILEDFIEGKEYRFLIIDDKCICVVHRRNASVVGDGKRTIRELIELKNKEPWHYVQKTLITIDKSMERLLKKQNLTLESIPSKGERIFVRHNSNISTGGESIEVTDQIPEEFKKVAVKATKIFGAKICGVDMMINDINKFEYAIVELNDNPGIDICEWPYEGQGQPVGNAILKLLKFI